jgi:hypothetical protein
VPKNKPTDDKAIPQASARNTQQLAPGILPAKVELSDEISQFPSALANDGNEETFTQPTGNLSTVSSALPTVSSVPSVSQNRLFEDQSKSSGEGLSAGAITGITMGVLLFIGLFIYVVIRRFRKKRVTAIEKQAPLGEIHHDANRNLSIPTYLRYNSTLPEMSPMTPLHLTPTIEKRASTDFSFARKSPVQASGLMNFINESAVRK